MIFHDLIINFIRKSILFFFDKILESTYTSFFLYYNFKALRFKVFKIYNNNFYICLHLYAISLTSCLKLNNLWFYLYYDMWSLILKISMITCYILFENFKFLIYFYYEVGWTSDWDPWLGQSPCRYSNHVLDLYIFIHTSYAI